MKIILIIGLPGSGKTTLARQMMREGDLLIDDISVAFEDKTKVELSLVGDLYITDPLAGLATYAMVNDKLADLFDFTECVVIPFENDPEACWVNLCDRNDGKISRMGLAHMSLKYYPERWGDPISVYRREREDA